MLALMILGVGCGARQPYEQRTGTPVIEVQSAAATFSANGFRIALTAQCKRQIADVWCPPRRVGTVCDIPPTIRTEAAECSGELAFKGVQVSLRSPWGQVHSAMSDANGVVTIPVDWSGTGVDPLSAGAAEQLATGWLVYSDTVQAIPLKIEPGDVERMRSAIGAATDTHYEVGAANEKAVLAAELTDRRPLVRGRTQTITLAVKNSGPQPAYRVIARLRSSVDALHGHQLSFGRIDPGKTKIRGQVVAIPLALDENSAVVVATISYFNGERFDINKKFEIASEAKPVPPTRGLAVDCKLATAEVAPGERVRIDCDLRNLGNEPANELAIQVSVGGIDSKNLTPKRIPGAGSTRLELIGLTSPKEKQGSQVPVVVRVGALGLPPIARTLSVRIRSFATKCETRLTRDEYRVKRKRLQAALGAGALTQQEFDKYDADLVTCLE